MVLVCLSDLLGIGISTHDDHGPAIQHFLTVLAPECHIPRDDRWNGLTTLRVVVCQMNYKVTLDFVGFVEITTIVRARRCIFVHRVRSLYHHRSQGRPAWILQSLFVTYVEIGNSFCFLKWIFW